MRGSWSGRGWIGEGLVWVVVGAAMAWVVAASWETVQTRPVWIDEAASWRSATENGFGALLLNEDGDERHPPLSFVVIRAVLGLTGSGGAGSVDLLWLRAGALGAGVLAVGMAGVLGRVALGRFGAVGCAVLAANDPVLLSQSQQARMFSLMVLGQLMAMVGAVVVLRGGVLGGRRGSIGLAECPPAEPGATAPRWGLLGAVLCGVGVAVAFNAVYLGLAVFGAVAGAMVWAVGWAAWSWWRGRGGVGGKGRVRRAGRVMREVAVVALIATLGSAGSLWFLGGFTLGGGSVHDKGSGLGWASVYDWLRAGSRLYGWAAVSGLTMVLGGLGLLWWCVGDVGRSAGGRWHVVRGVGGVGGAWRVMLVLVCVLSLLIPLRVRATSHGFVAGRFFSAVGPSVWLGVTTLGWVFGVWLTGALRRGEGGRRGVWAGVVGGAVVLGVAGLWRAGWSGVEWELRRQYPLGAVVTALREAGVGQGDRYEIEPPYEDKMLEFAGLPQLTVRRRSQSDVIESWRETRPADGGSWYLVVQYLRKDWQAASAAAVLDGMYRRWWGGALPAAVFDHVRAERLGVYRLDGDGSVWFGVPVRDGRGWVLRWEVVVGPGVNGGGDAVRVEPSD
ncbi:MAG: hypothetical protein AAGI68_02605 [Planctomycetota bacterium]